MRWIGNLLVVLAAGCATTISGNERGLFYSASSGMSKSPVGSGWYWHWPWNHYVVYDMRWQSHTEQIHIHSKDGLHMDIDVNVVVRPNPDELYELDHDVGPHFYDQVVKPALFGAARDAVGKFDHVQIVTDTHTVEEAMRAALIEHLKGQHISVAEVAIQHFDLPQELEDAANRQAASSQLLAAKEVDLHLAERDAEIDKAKRKGQIEAEGLEKQMRSEQELEQTKADLDIEKAKREAELEAVKAETDEKLLRAQADAKAIELEAEAEKARQEALSKNLTPNYVRLQALDTLAKALSGGNTKVIVVPTDKNGMPALWAPFFNPFGNLDTVEGKLGQN